MHDAHQNGVRASLAYPEAAHVLQGARRRSGTSVESGSDDFLGQLGMRVEGPPILERHQGRAVQGHLSASNAGSMTWSMLLPYKG